MAANVSICSIDGDLKEKLKKFRFRKATNNAAIIMKIEKEKRMIILDEEYEDCSVEDIRDELPDSQPRFIVYSYCCCNPEQQMMYAGSMKSLVSEVSLGKGVAGALFCPCLWSLMFATQVFEVRNPEDLTEEWLREKLQFFR